MILVTHEFFVNKILCDMQFYAISSCMFFTVKVKDCKKRT